MTAFKDSEWPRIVIHADMDAFYASVEQLDNPDLRGLPVLVGPNSNRGVVLTASYEARPYRVGSAMPVAEARRRCPDAVFVPPRFERYKELSQRVMTVFADFSPRVEAISLDEAFLEMTGATEIFGPPDEMARALKAQVYEATGGLTVSVGVSVTKYVAKVASGFAKPDGTTIVPASAVVSWLAPQDVSRLWGAGPKTQDRLRNLGYHQIGQLAAADPRELRARLGSAGSHFFELANGRDPRRVSRGRRAKSLSSDRTLAQDVSSRAEILQHLQRSADRVAKRLRAKQLTAQGVRIKLKTNRFELITRQRTLPPCDEAARFQAVATQLLDELLREGQRGPFRLVGIATFNLAPRAEPLQLGLFDAGANRRLEQVIDAVNEKFGDGSVHRARDLGKDTIFDHNVNLDFVEDGEPPD